MPCRCLCLGLEEHITYTRPRRLTVLQNSQNFLTDDRTFIVPMPKIITLNTIAEKRASLMAKCSKLTKKMKNKIKASARRIN